MKYFLIQSGDEPRIMESIRKPKIEGRNPHKKVYQKSLALYNCCFPSILISKMYLNSISLKNTKPFFFSCRLLNHVWKASLEDNQHRGRPSYSVLPFLRAALAKRYFKIVATSDLRLRLLSDTNLKQICGFENIPSAASFSRYMSYLADNASL